MTNPTEPSVLRRMVAPPRPPQQSGGGAMDRGVTVAFPRSADALLGLAIEVEAVSQATTEKADILADLTPSDLAFVLATGNGVGLVLLDSGLLAALVEIQITGRVTNGPPAGRSPTRTDAVMAGDIVDRWIADVEQAMTDGEGRAPSLAGAERADRFVDTRAADLLLDPIRYHCIRIEMSVSGGAKTGCFRLVVPARSGAGHSDRPECDLAIALRPHLHTVRTRMRAVLGQVSLPLSDALALSPDRVFPVNAGDIRRVTLVRDGGRPICEAQLGQIDGTWAVRPVATRRADSPVAALTALTFEGGTGPRVSPDVQKPESAAPDTQVAGRDDTIPATGSAELPKLPPAPGGDGP